MTLIQWLSTLPLERIIVFAIVSLLGMAGSVLKKWGAGELTGSIADYIFRERPQRTLAALGAWATGVATALFAGSLPDTPWGMLISGAFTLGYTCNSTVNRGHPVDPNEQDRQSQR